MHSADPQDLANLRDSLDRISAAIVVARRSSRWRALTGESVGAVLLLALLLAGLGYLIGLNPFLVAPAALVPLVLGWLALLVVSPHLFAPGHEAHSELLLAYSEAERIIGALAAEAEGELQLGWGVATPSEWSYGRQAALIEQTRRALSSLRDATR